MSRRSQGSDNRICLSLYSKRILFNKFTELSEARGSELTDCPFELDVTVLLHEVKTTLYVLSFYLQALGCKLLKQISVVVVQHLSFLTGDSLIYLMNLMDCLSCFLRVTYLNIFVIFFPPIMFSNIFVFCRKYTRPAMRNPEVSASTTVILQSFRWTQYLKSSLT